MILYVVSTAYVSGKGEKVVYETTSRRVIVELYFLEVASSCKPSSESCSLDVFDNGGG